MDTVWKYLVHCRKGAFRSLALRISSALNKHGSFVPFIQIRKLRKSSSRYAIKKNLSIKNLILKRLVISFVIVLPDPTLWPYIPLCWCSLDREQNNRTPLHGRTPVSSSQTLHGPAVKCSQVWGLGPRLLTLSHWNNSRACDNNEAFSCLPLIYTPQIWILVRYLLDLLFLSYQG